MRLSTFPDSTQHRLAKPHLGTQLYCNLFDALPRELLRQLPNRHGSHGGRSTDHQDVQGCTGKLPGQLLNCPVSILLDHFIDAAPLHHQDDLLAHLPFLSRDVPLELSVAIVQQVTKSVQFHRTRAPHSPSIVSVHGSDDPSLLVPILLDPYPLPICPSVECNGSSMLLSFPVLKGCLYSYQLSLQSLRHNLSSRVPRFPSQSCLSHSKCLVPCPEEFSQSPDQVCACP